MSMTPEMQSALQTHHQNIETACRQKRKIGLALPAILTSLESLPANVRETVGTVTRSTVIKLLVTESYCESRMEEVEAQYASISSAILHWISQSLFGNDGDRESRDDKAKRSLTEEAIWLAQNINRESVTQCLLLADFAFIAGMHAEAKQIYQIGLETAMQRAKDHPGEAIFE